MSTTSTGIPLYQAILDLCDSHKALLAEIPGSGPSVARIDGLRALVVDASQDASAEWTLLGNALHDLDAAARGLDQICGFAAGVDHTGISTITKGVTATRSLVGSAIIALNRITEYAPTSGVPTAAESDGSGQRNQRDVAPPRVPAADASGMTPPPQAERPTSGVSLSDWEGDPLTPADRSPAAGDGSLVVIGQGTYARAITPAAVGRTVLPFLGQRFNVPNQIDTYA